MLCLDKALLRTQWGSCCPANPLWANSRGGYTGALRSSDIKITLCLSPKHAFSHSKLTAKHSPSATNHIAIPKNDFTVRNCMDKKIHGMTKDHPRHDDINQ